MGVDPEPTHASVRFRASGGETAVFAVFASDTDYFGESGQPFMVNLRVDDLDGVRRQLAVAGVKVAPEIEDGEYGRFGWAEDCDGRRIELWEPPEGA